MRCAHLTRMQWPPSSSSSSSSVPAMPPPVPVPVSAPSVPVPPVPSPAPGRRPLAIPPIGLVIASTTPTAARMSAVERAPELPRDRLEVHEVAGGRFESVVNLKYYKLRTFRLKS